MNALYCYINKKDLAATNGPNKLLLFAFQSQVILFLILLFTFLFKTKVSSSETTIISPLSQNTTSVLGVTQEPTPTITPTLPPPTPTLTPTPTVIALPKRAYSIAILGDSMVDTMGERLEYLEHSLKRRYPTTEFSLYNYGRGAETVAVGLARLHSEFNYQDRHYPPLSELRPDILIIGSFAYNPFTPYDRDKHWLTLAQLVNEAKRISPQVYLLAEIAPLRNDFGKGVNGVNWESDTAYQHSARIIEQLENTVGLSRSLPVPLIDAFTPSQINGEKEGKRTLVNSHDGIHPSVAGHEFIAEIITNTLKFE